LLLIPYAGITRIKLRVSGFSLLSADFLSTPVFYFQNQHNDNAKVIDCQQTANKNIVFPADGQALKKPQAGRGRSEKEHSTEKYNAGRSI